MFKMTINLKYKALSLLIVLLGLLSMVVPVAAQTAPPPPVVRLEVNPQTAKVGDTISIAVRLENVTRLYGLQVVCQVDPTVLKGLSRIEGDAFNSGNSFYVDQGIKADGKWLIAATRLQPNPEINGNGTAFTFQYVLQQAVNANLTCSTLGADSHSAPVQLTLVNATPIITTVVGTTAAVPTAIVPTVEVSPTAEVTATEIVPTEIAPTPESTPAAVPVGAASTVHGVVINQFQTDNANIQIQLTSNGSLLQQTTTGADGVFSFADVPAGTYVLLASASSHLSLFYNVMVTGDGTAVDLGTQTLVMGDTDGNQTIDLADAVLISANFDLAVPPAPEGADLNHDGQINVSDLVLIGANFGLTGPIEVK